MALWIIAVLSVMVLSFSFEAHQQTGINVYVRERDRVNRLVEPGRIRVESADCPDKVCVNQGYISDGTVPIACLPHKLIIRIEGGDSGLDAAN